MRKIKGGVSYDTAAASLIAETESITLLSGRISVRVYRSQISQWFKVLAPIDESSKSTITNWISPKTARRWLEKRSFTLQLREYFGISASRLHPDRQVLVAEWKCSESYEPNDLIQIDRLYYHPQKGWFIRQQKEAVLIPLTAAEAGEVVKTLWGRKGHIQTSGVSIASSLYEHDHFNDRRISP